MGDAAKADPALIEDFHWLDDPKWGAAGFLLLMPFQASIVNLWLNVAGGALGFGLLAYEMKQVRGAAHVRA